MNKSVICALALGIASLGLSACGQSEQPTEAAPEAPAGISVTNGRLILPAVAGNPAAIYFDISNSGPEQQMIRSASVQGASHAMLHKTSTWNLQASMEDVPQLPVAPGQTVRFAPGEYHVMASDLADTLVAGGTTEVTLTFIRGDKVSFPVEIRAAGDER
ncbi:copper chaperone PCu(A)C [Altererythrobacter xixiisoli]|uniref:Copper chaperone PCu(A)C n=1 Tax=Croceibacterium xixiisoli TaxID=1476466 RepID=A0A6I4TZG2_9SPHN|nr:copper chaperone PCu(A)C [Croceibacterium xixiisoli]MXP00009.1 copper chaperone PCu(A)C [Croceibacterium xixiisoli]